MGGGGERTRECRHSVREVLFSRRSGVFTRDAAMWTKDTLQELVRKRLGDHRFMVVANREPYQHRYAGGRVECVAPASGMVSALDPVLRAAGGVWVGHGSGNADRATADSSGRLRVPPDHPRYTLRRVWLTKAEEDGYY